MCLLQTHLKRLLSLWCLNLLLRHRIIVAMASLEIEKSSSSPEKRCFMSAGESEVPSVAQVFTIKNIVVAAGDACGPLSAPASASFLSATRLQDEYDTNVTG